MESSVTDTLTAHLLRLSESGPAVLSGAAARRYSAREIDRLLAESALEELAPATEWSPCADCECALGFRPIRTIGSRPVACCPLDPGSDLELGPEDLRAFRIDVGRLLNLVARASGIAGPTETIAPGLWRLGRLASGRTIVVALPARALRTPGAILLLKSASGPVTVVARNPDHATSLRLLEAGIDLIELNAILLPAEQPSDRRGVDVLERRAAQRNGEVELVVRKGAATIEWRGAPIGLTHQQFPVLLRLLEGSRSRSGIASGPAVEDMTGREAKDLIRELRQRVEAAGFSGSEAKSLFKAVHGRGYTLGVAPEKITVEE
jgi:hypothetical protein